MVATVTIPEGMTQAQIFALLEAKGVSTADKLEETAANYDFKFSFLKGVLPLGDASAWRAICSPTLTSSIWARTGQRAQQDDPAV